MDLPTLAPSLLPGQGSNPSDMLYGLGTFNPIGTLNDISSGLSSVTGIPAGLGPAVAQEGTLADKASTFIGSDVAGFFARFGLEILGGMFIFFGFLMLAFRGGDAVADSELGRAVARVAK